MDGWSTRRRCISCLTTDVMTASCHPFLLFLMCFFCQCERAAAANCCYNYSCCYNSGHWGVVTIARRETAPRVKVDMLSLFMGVMSKQSL